ncbi:M16 family metallopeptidase [Acidobacteriota bacterium]
MLQKPLGKKLIVNGQRIYHLRKPFPPDLVYLRIGFRVGSRDDTVWGISHLLEHMLFKGTGTRTWEQINRDLAYLGAFINAETGREYTVFYITVLKDQFEKAAAILADILLNSTFPKNEFDKEKDVVKNEIFRSIDSVNAYGFDRAHAHYFSDDLGHPILGTPETVKGTTLDELIRFRDMFYTRENSVIAAVGDISRQSLLRVVKKHFSFPHGTISRTLQKQTFRAKRVSETRSNMQNSLVIYRWPGLAMRHHDTAAYEILRGILGGGMNSLLHREIREKLGLAYGINARTRYHQDVGYFAITSQINETNLNRYHRTVLRILTDLCERGVDKDDFISSKNQLELAIRQDEESGFYLCNSQCIRYLFELPSFEEFTSQLRAVKRSKVKSLARSVFKSKPFRYILTPA